jgi:hypothetical protein
MITDLVPAICTLGFRAAESFSAPRLGAVSSADDCRTAARGLWRGIAGTDNAAALDGMGLKGHGKRMTMRQSL